MCRRCGIVVLGVGRSRASRASFAWPLTGQVPAEVPFAIASSSSRKLVAELESRLPPSRRSWRRRSDVQRVPSWGPSKVVRCGHRAALTESPLGSMTASLFPAHNCATCNLVCVIIMLLFISYIYTVICIYCEIIFLKDLIRFTLSLLTFFVTCFCYLE